jgi:hypothetical protein
MLSSPPPFGRSAPWKQTWTDFSPNSRTTSTREPDLPQSPNNPCFQHSQPYILQQPAYPTESHDLFYALARVDVTGPPAQIGGGQPRGAQGATCALCASEKGCNSLSLPRYCAFSGSRKRRDEGNTSIWFPPVILCGVQLDALFPPGFLFFL